MKPKVKVSKEGKLTSLFDKYCHKHNIPTFEGVNGPRVEGWTHIPDRVMGEAKDDLLTKCVVIEIKPTKEGAVNDLRSKEEYKAVKFLAAIYYENGIACGSLYSWRNPKGELGFEEMLPTQPLDGFINDLYNRAYKPAINPNKTRVVNEAIKLTGQYSAREVFNVMSGSFMNEPKPGELPYSLNEFWSLCDKINLPGSKTEILHDIVFAPNTHKERHKWGQFITEYPHSLKIAEKVVEIFDEHQNLTIYEPCVGTGAIACELLTLLFRKYGMRKSKKMMKEQLKFADIGPRMRAYAAVVLKLHTEKLFGEGNGIHFNIEMNDLETDNFNLSKMIVYGNYPFNKGNDYNYLARLLKKQMDCGLSLGVFMGDSATFDHRKAQSKKILGEDFYTWIKEEYNTNDFKDVAVKISVVSFDKSKGNNKEGLTNVQVEVIRLLHCGIRWEQLPNDLDSIPFIRPIYNAKELYKIELYANTQKVKEYTNEQEIWDILDLYKRKFVIPKQNINTVQEIQMQKALGTITEDVSLDPTKIKKIQNLVKQFEDGLNKFITLDNFVSIRKLPDVMPLKLRDGTKLYNDSYNLSNSFPYYRQKDIVKGIDAQRIPSPTAQAGSLEKELYDQWCKENSTYTGTYNNQGILLSSRLIKNGEAPTFRFTDDPILSAAHSVIAWEGTVKDLGVVGLIMTSLKGIQIIHQITAAEYGGKGLRTTQLLKQFPIPKNIPDRLYEMGQTLIIEGKEDQALRDEADGIIEGLYKGLEI